jgi:dienelactone hydrolase
LSRRSRRRRARSAVRLVRQSDLPGCSAATVSPFPVVVPPLRLHACRAAGSRCAVPGRAAGQRAPGLVVLYGCGGFGRLDPRLAQQFARARFATMYLDTYALTPPPGRRGFCGVATTPAIRATWRATVLAAARALASRRGVDPQRIGLLGWSDGADLALAVAPTPGAGIDAVVAYSPDVFPQPAAREPGYPPAIELLSTVGDVHSLRRARARFTSP